MRNETELLTANAERAFQSGHAADAVKLCEQAIALDPDYVPALHTLRIIAYRQGDGARSSALLKRILGIDPNHVESLNGMANVLRQQGKLTEALEYCARALKLRPNYIQALNTIGLCQLAQGEATAAAKSFRQVIALQPRLPAAHLNLGAALQRLGRTEAAECYRRAAALAPGTPTADEALGRLSVMERNEEEAVRCFTRMLEQCPSSMNALLMASDAFLQLGLSQKASEVAEKAIAIDPSSGEAYSHLGLALLDLGDFEQAREALQQSIALSPRQAQAYVGLVTSRKVSAEDSAIVKDMTRLLDANEVCPHDKARLHAGLAKAYDDLGQYELAISNADKGNRISIELDPGEEDVDAMEAHVEHLIHSMDRDYFLEHALLGLSDSTPIFITGLPRSGTTLVEQILSSHSAVAAGGELRYWDNVSYRFRGHPEELAERPEEAKDAAEKYLKRLRKIGPDARHVTDKFNDNLFNLGLLHLLFPKAKILYCKRNALDNCLSIYLTPFRNKSHGFRTRAGIIKYYELASRIGEHWSRVLPGESLCEVSYEDLVSDPELAVKEFVGFCGLEWEEACLRPNLNPRAVATPSRWQARQPIYQTSMSRWMRYEPWLGEFARLRQP